MTRTVEIAGFPPMEFPDGTPDAVIQQTVQRMVQGDTPAPATQTPDRIGGREALQQAAQGLSLGFGDELTAGLTALLAKTQPGEQPFMETFRDVLESERMQIAQTQEEHPVASTALQIAGALPTGGVGATRAAGAKVLQGAVTRGGKMLQGTGRAAAAGAPGGAVFGAGTTEGGVAERAVGAAEGGLVGAAGGAVLKPVVAATTAIARTPARVLRGAVRSLTNGEKRQADLQVARSLRDLGDDPIEAAQQRLAEAGDDATLLDVGSDAVAVELERVASMPGVGRNRVVNEIERRLDDQPTQLTDEVRQIFMPQAQLAVGGQRTGQIVKTFKQANEEITDMAAAKAAPFYARAYKAGVNNTAKPLQNLLKNPRIAKAMKDAVKRIKSETIDDADPDAAVLKRLQDEADAANPNLMVWDRTKRALDSERTRAFTAGDASLGREIGKNVKQLRTVLDKQVPVYGKARKIWAGGQQEAEAHTLGQQALARLDDLPGGTTADDLADLFDDMSDAGKQAYRMGYGQRLENVINTTDDGGTQAVSLATRIVGSPDKRKLLTDAIPDAGQRNAFVKSLQLEKGFTTRANKLLSGSHAKVNAFLKDEGKGKVRTIISNLIAGQFALSGNQFAQLRLATSALTGTRSTLPGVDRRVAERLLETRGAQLRTALDDLDKLVRIPKSLKDVQGLSGAQLTRFFLDNPTARRQLNEAIAGASAAVLTAPENRRALQQVTDNEQ